MNVEDQCSVEFVGEKKVPIQKGQSLLEAALAANIPHYHACGGMGKCTTCRVLVKEGSQWLTAPNEREQETWKKMQFSSQIRLACQTYVEGGPVRVHRIIRDETDRSMYVSGTGEEMQDIGEERVLALFFLDIRDFTPFMEANLPFDVMHIMRRLFNIFHKAIETHHGRIIETAGDGLYAVFGLNTPIEAATQSAVQAGYVIMNELINFNQTYLQTYFCVHLDVGIGVNVGRVILGNIGFGGTTNMTVMGYPVNIASRLQAATRQLNNSFIISDEAYQLLPPAAAGTDAVQISLKGVTDLLTVHLIGKPYRTE